MIKIVSDSSINGVNKTMTVFKVGDLVTPNYDEPWGSSEYTIREHLINYNTNPELPYLVKRGSIVGLQLVQGNLSVGYWQSKYWKPWNDVIDLDQDDEDCI